MHHIVIVIVLPVLLTDMAEFGLSNTIDTAFPAGLQLMRDRTQERPTAQTNSEVQKTPSIWCCAPLCLLALYAHLNNEISEPVHHDKSLAVIPNLLILHVTSADIQIHLQVVMTV